MGKEGRGGGIKGSYVLMTLMLSCVLRSWPTGSLTVLGTAWRVPWASSSLRSSSRWPLSLVWRRPCLPWRSLSTFSTPTALSRQRSQDTYWYVCDLRYPVHRLREQLCTYVRMFKLAAVVLQCIVHMHVCTYKYVRTYVCVPMHVCMYVQYVDWLTTYVHLL